MNSELTESMRGTPPPKSTEEAWKEREKYISQLESRLRALWDKYDRERAHYIDRIKRLEEEARVLRLYGNKDCTAQADEVLKREAKP